MTKKDFLKQTIIALFLFCFLLHGQFAIAEEVAKEAVKEVVKETVAEKSAVPSAPVPMVEQYLQSGELAKGEAALIAHLKQNPTDDEARFGLGMLQFLRAIEGFSQSGYKYGAFNLDGLGPMALMLGVNQIQNSNPEKINYKKYRQIFLDLLANLKRAEATLSQVKSNDVKLRIHFGMIRLDFDDNGKSSERERFLNIYARFNRLFNEELQKAEKQKEFHQFAKKFAITFDKADVYWLQGYCNLLMAVDQFFLAHDWEDSFNRTGQLLFPKKEETHPFLNQSKKSVYGLFHYLTMFEDYAYSISDLFVFAHLLRVDVKEPKRLEESLKHFEKVFAISRLNFKAIQAETDNVEEWVPGPNQTGVMPGVKVTKEMIVDWHKFLDEMDLIFAGKKLIPHWRLKKGKGINLRAFFLKSKRFDPVLLHQGTDLGPFVEDGEVATAEMWTQLQATFRGNFFGFAIWFN